MGYVFIFTALWLFNLLNGTGLGNAYYTTELMMIVCVVLSISKMIYRITRTGEFVCKKNHIFTLVSFFTVALVSAVFRNHLNTTLQFLWVYFLVYMIKDFKMKEKYLAISCNLYGVFGVSILYLFNYTELLSGWNENTISMIALYSYLFFLLPHYGNKNFFKQTFVLIVSIIYFLILIGTNSRAAMLFSIIAFMFTMFNSKIKIIKKNNITFFLLIPMIVSLFVIVVSNTSLMEVLDSWSLKEFDKPIFNGRDELWKSGFDILKVNVMFGSGNIMKANWHNSAITLLVSYGVLGYVLWFISFKYILKKSLSIKYDRILSGCLVLFFVMYAHQSVELGFISSKPNILPYIMIGIALSRANYLERFEHYDDTTKVN